VRSLDTFGDGSTYCVRLESSDSTQSSFPRQFLFEFARPRIISTHPKHPVRPSHNTHTHTACTLMVLTTLQTIGAGAKKAALRVPEAAQATGEGWVRGYLFCPLLGKKVSSAFSFQCCFILCSGAVFVAAGVAAKAAFKEEASRRSVASVVSDAAGAGVGGAVYGTAIGAASGVANPNLGPPDACGRRPR
jgi:hypothetical protein